MVWSELEKQQVMNRANGVGLTFLVVEDVAETREGIEKLLKVSGYRVESARDELDAVESARRKRPDLLLVSLDGTPLDIIATARRIRARAQLGDNVPVVIFYIEELGEGDEVAVGQNVYLTRPDNFDQLRNLFTRLLCHRLNID